MLCLRVLACPCTVLSCAGRGSNMNYCLAVSNSTMELMEEKGITDSSLALSMVQDAAQGEFMAGGDVAMGSIILLVDSDTR